MRPDLDHVEGVWVEVVDGVADVAGMGDFCPEDVADPLPARGGAGRIVRDGEEADLEEVDGLAVVLWQMPAQLVALRAAYVHHVVVDIVVL